MNEVNGIRINGIIGVNSNKINWVQISDSITQFVDAASYDKFVTLLEVAARNHNYDSDISHIISVLITHFTKFTRDQRCSFILRLMKLRSDNSVCSRYLLSILRMVGRGFLNADTVVEMLSHRSMRSYLLIHCGQISAYRLRLYGIEILFYFDCVMRVIADSIYESFWQRWFSVLSVRKKYKQFALFAAYRSDIMQLNTDECIGEICRMLEYYACGGVSYWDSEVTTVAMVLRILISRGLNIFKVVKRRRIISQLRFCRKVLNELAVVFND